MPRRLELALKTIVTTSTTNLKEVPTLFKFLEDI
ncbi:hypothetical protein MY3296_004774 [Beauveria thailandica]